MEVITIKVRTLTPIWTGDIDRKCMKIKETGIIGSLRWWYETIVRGYGGKACDPTSSTCGNEDHCDACELLGCTGWSRKIKVIIREYSPELVPEIRVRTRERRRTRSGFRYLSRIFQGIFSEDISLQIMPIREVSGYEWYLLRKTLNVIHNYGAIGGRIAQGNGVIRIVKLKVPEAELPSPYEDLEYFWNKEFRGATINSPNLKDFFFYKFQLAFSGKVKDLIKKRRFWGSAGQIEDWVKVWDKYGILPIGFHVRDMLRRELISDRSRRHEIFGKRGRGSKVFVSHAYKVNGNDEDKVELRIFGYSLFRSEIEIIPDVFANKLPFYISQDPNRPIPVGMSKISLKRGGELL